MSIPWQDISAFTPAVYEDGGDFLVWVPIPDTGENGESGAPFIAQWGRDFIVSEDTEPHEAGEPRFQGEWRHIKEFENLEPVALVPVISERKLPRND
jgi:hypothetical protein